MKLEKILIITLRERPDKRDIVAFHMKALGWNDFEFIYGLSGSEFLRNSPSNEKLQAATGLTELSVDFDSLQIDNPAHFGAFYSHLMAINYLVKNEINGPVLILEDDVLADDKAPELIERYMEELPPDWGLFYPGHCDTRWMCEKTVGITGNICQAGGHVTCAHSYIVNGKKAAEELIETGRREKFALADLFAHKSKLLRFVLFPSLFTQFKEYFDVRSDIGSEGGHFPKLENEMAALATKQFYLDLIGKSRPEMS